MQSPATANRSDELYDLDELADFMVRHPRLLVLTGAGCSTESGIPDYRDVDGEWKHKRPIQYQDFLASEHMRQRYWARSLVGWRRIDQARPNAAHRALACLEEAGFIHQLVTQNVDGLHQKAGSQWVIDLHGRLDTIECLNCRGQSPRSRFQRILETQNPAFRRVAAVATPDGDVALEGVDFRQFRIPACSRCGGILKPHVVFFGESIPRSRVELASRRLEEADGLLVVGSSLMVFSGYRFCRAAVAQHKPIVAINLGRTRADADLTFKVMGRCGEVLAELTERLGLV